MDEAATFATKAELDQVRKEQRVIAIQLEANTRALAGLTREIAELSERTERLEGRMDAMEARFERLENVVADSIAESRTSHTSLMSAIMSLRQK